MSTPISIHGASAQERLTIPLELDLEEDIETEIHHFVKLARTGDYAAAHEFFHCTLQHHDHLFPVVAEYADMLLEQGCYGRAAVYLERQIDTRKGALAPDEMQLLRLMKSLAEIYCKGALRSALAEARRAWQHLDYTAKQSLAALKSVTSIYAPHEWKAYIDLFSDVQLHIFELYVTITALGLHLSNAWWKGLEWVDESWMCCPFLRPGMVARGGIAIETEDEFVDWFLILTEVGLVWEASRILRSILPMMDTLSPESRDALLRYNANDSGALPDLWAGLTLTINQVRFLLKETLLPLPLGQIPTQAWMAEWSDKLELAERIWERALQVPGGGARPPNLHLALERLYFELVRSDGRLDSMGALLEIVSAADRRQDLQSQVLARLCILVYGSPESLDWRDLHSIFELCEIDCGNLLECLRIWDMFARWALASETPANIFPFRHCTLAISRLPPDSPRDQSHIEWARLLHGRTFLHLEQPVNGKETLGPSCDDYDPMFDIPVHWSRRKFLKEELERVLNGQQADSSNRSSVDISEWLRPEWLPEEFLRLSVLSDHTQEPPLQREDSTSSGSSHLTQEPVLQKEDSTSSRWSFNGMRWKLRDIGRSLPPLFLSSDGKGSQKEIKRPNIPLPARADEPTLPSPS
ncbi:hypothetical protein BJY00DRAFT_287803 [Aspergillus carlsbadensis]|nr:hypothetical protein BJY00DRAFT_287803 [Aspergillus carlsbadensis]